MLSRAAASQQREARLMTWMATLLRASFMFKCVLSFMLLLLLVVVSALLLFLYHIHEPQLRLRPPDYIGQKSEVWALA